MAKRKAAPAPAATPAIAASTSKGGKPFFKNKRTRFEGAAEVLEVVKPIKKTPKAVKKVIKAVPTPPAPTTFIVSAGSYERLLYGLEGQLVPKATGSTSTQPYDIAITPVFSFPAHLSSLRTVSSSILPSPGTGSERKVGGKYLVSGGTDEVIKVWDLKRKKEVGSLEGEAAGTITCLRFVAQRNILLAASTDSAITMYRVRDWVLLRALKGHKGRVNSIDAHPDGRVALSVGQDKMLRMWDLVAGKAVATMKVGEEGDVVRWNTDGTKFAIICASTLTVYGIDMSVHHVLTAPSRFHDLRFAYFPIDASDPTQSEYLFVACEDGKTRVFDITTSASTAQKAGEETAAPSIAAIAELVGHANRVKMIDLLEVACPDSTPTSPTSTIILSTVSSDGLINLYDLATLKSARSTAKEGEIVEVSPTSSHDTDGSRLTCVCVIGMPKPKIVKGEEEEDEEESEEDSEGDSEEEDEEEFAVIASGSENEEDIQFEDEEEEEGEVE